MDAILIDGSWHSRRALKSCTPVLDFFGDNLESHKDIFMAKLASNFAGIIRNIGNVLVQDTIIIYALDDSSWRKRFPTRKNQVYKGNRKKDASELDWNVFKEVSYNFGKLLEEKFNVIFVCEYELEADDSAYIFSRLLNKYGLDCLLIASDGDWKQCINDKTHYLKKRGGKVSGYDFVRIKQDIKKPSMMDIFSDLTLSNDGMNEVQFHLSRNFNTIHENPYHFIFEKVVGGDSKDNIFPIFDIPTKTGNSGRRHKPTGKKLEKALSQMGLDSVDSFEIMYDKDFIKKFLGIISDQMCVLDHGEYTMEDITKNYFLNLKLLHLDKKHIPNDIIKRVIKGWTKKRIIEHKTNVYDLEKANKIYNGSEQSTVDIISSNYRDVEISDIEEDEYY